MPLEDSLKVGDRERMWTDCWSLQVEVKSAGAIARGKGGTYAGIIRWKAVVATFRADKQKCLIASWPILVRVCNA